MDLKNREDELQELPENERLGYGFCQGFLRRRGGVQLSAKEKPRADWPKNLGQIGLGGVGLSSFGAFLVMGPKG